MDTTVTVSILGIGTELTSGQILNSNAQWISQKMSKLGADCKLQIVVPDERPLILEALKKCAEISNTVFITGGLGPTSDDFTRDMIAQWTGLAMKWDEGSWKHLNERLLARNIPVKEMQRQQCYFPEGSQILTNKMGTANGFQLHFQGKDVFVLPGPPREIESIWQDWIASWATERCRAIDAIMVKSWDTLGYGESQVAEITEEILKDSSLERGYRVHLPYVEFKLIYKKSQAKLAETYCENLDKALAHITVLKNGEDIAQLLAEKLKLFPAIQLVDQLPGSPALRRLFPFCRALLDGNKISFSNHETTSGPELHLKISMNKDKTAKAEICYLGVQENIQIQSPYTSTAMIERSHQYFAERAMVFFLDRLAKTQLIAKT